MSIHVPALNLSVPVVWKPSPDHYAGRNGYQPLVIVHHRAVSSQLSGIDTTLISSSRQVSANFAIGHVGGRLEIHQYVDLSDGAWCNGDCQQAQYPAEPSNFDKWYGHRGHNERTVSIEHEDQGGSADPTKKGIVTEDILLAGIELDRLMLSGDLAAMRLAGVHVRLAETAAALGKIVPSSKTLIRHYDIAGKLKPYCWRPWQADHVGFPQTRYIAALTAAPIPPPPPPAPAPTPETDMPALTSYIPGQVATILPGVNVRTSPRILADNSNRIRVTAAAEAWTVTGWVKGDVDPSDGSDQWLARWNATRWEYTAHSNVSAGPADPTPFSAAQVTGAKQAQYDLDAKSIAVTPATAKLSNARPA